VKLGLNSVLFGGYDMETAFRYTAMAGYDGIELSAIDGMSEHLVLSRWREVAPEIKRLSAEYGLALLAMEQPSQDAQVMETAFQAAAEIGIPIVNCGPGGKADDDATLQASIDSLGKLAEMAGRYGVTLCVKAHVGAAIWNTPTTLRAMAAISHPAFGIDMDPSHIHRGNENPVEAIADALEDKEKERQTQPSAIHRYYKKECEEKTEDREEVRDVHSLYRFLKVVVLS